MFSLVLIDFAFFPTCRFCPPGLAPVIWGLWICSVSRICKILRATIGRMWLCSGLRLFRSLISLRRRNIWGASSPKWSMTRRFWRKPWSFESCRCKLDANQRSPLHLTIPRCFAPPRLRYLNPEEQMALFFGWRHRFPIHFRWSRWTIWRPRNRRRGRQPGAPPASCWGSAGCCIPCCVELCKCALNLFRALFYCSTINGLKGPEVWKSNMQYHILLG